MSLHWGLLFSFVLKLNKFSSSCGPSLCEKQGFLKLSNHLAYYRHLSINSTLVISLTGNNDCKNACIDQ